MCVQNKQRYDLCPHVAYDYNVMECKLAASGMLCKFQITQIPEAILTGTRHEGKCHCCELEEQDAREAKQKNRRTARRLDLFEVELIANKNDGSDTSKETDDSDEADKTDDTDYADDTDHTDSSDKDDPINV